MNCARRGRARGLLLLAVFFCVISVCFPQGSIPEPGGGWWQIAGLPDLDSMNHPDMEPVDFAIWQAEDGSWQLVSCIRKCGPDGESRVLHRWEGKQMRDTMWEAKGIFMVSDSSYGEQPGWIQAPWVLEKDGLFKFYYGGGGQICLAEGPDGKNFRRVVNEDGKTSIFECELYGRARDIMIMEYDGRYYGYYTGSMINNWPDDTRGAVFCRVSDDLQKWGPEIMVSETEEDVVAFLSSECPQVHLIGDHFYLFKTQEYAPGKQQTTVFRSPDPLNFGINTDSFRIRTLPVAAPEIFKIEDKYYMAALMPDLKGIRLTELDWIKQGVEHPYLFFSASDLPDIRKRMESEVFGTRWKIFLNNADAVLNTSPQYYDPESGTTGRARKYIENAGKTSFAYIISGEEKYARRAIEEAMAMVSGVFPNENGELDWYNPDHRNWNKGADLNTAEICYALAMVYDWCYDQLSGEEKAAIREAIEQKGLGHYLYSIEGKVPDFWVDNPVSNWAGVVHGGVGLAALAIYDESEMARRSVDYARRAIPAFLDHVFLEDGGAHEGIMYARYGELFAIYFSMASQRLFGMDEGLLGQLNQRLAGYWDVYMQAPDGQYANFNNMNQETFEGLWGRNHRGHGGPNSDLNALFATLAPEEDPLLLWAADNGAPRFYWNGASPWFFLWRSDKAGIRPAEAKPVLQEAVLFRGAGHALFRSDKLWLAFNGGWTSNRSHNNRDLGSFILVAGEERMIHDPGYGDADAAHHSTIALDDEDQLQAQSGNYLAFGSGRDFHYLANDLSDAYGDESLDRFIRHLVFVKDKYILLLDEVNVKQGVDWTWRLQTRHAAVKSGDQDAVIQAEHHSMQVVHAGDPAEMRIEAWEGRNGRLNALCKTPNSNSQEQLLVTLLFPCEAGSTGDDRAQVEFSGGLVKVSGPGVKGDIICFRKDGDSWRLERFNDERHLEFGDGSERSLDSFRNSDASALPAEELPPWFFPIKNP